MTERLSRLSAFIAAIDVRLQRQAILWFALLLALALGVALYTLPAASGDWYRSGNDMIYILPPLRTARPADLYRWLTGPWIGVELFSYYRPVTSLLWYAQFQWFGEQVKQWQLVSIVLHSASVVSLTLLLSKIFPSRLAALGGALCWATRSKIVATLEWTPAQTDHFATFFGITALTCFRFGLDPTVQRARRIVLMSVATLFVVLALGSKEIAYPVPLLAIVLTWFSPLPKRTRAMITGGCLCLLGAFVAWRIFAMHGIGFLPGTATAGRSQTSPITPIKLLLQYYDFLVPTSLGSHSLTPLPALFALLAAIVFGIRKQPTRNRIAIFAGGIIVASFFLGGIEYFLIPDTYESLAYGLVALGIFAFTIRQRFNDCLLALFWGIVAHLPLYHVVYNAAGNVNYLPGTYWAIAWSAFLMGILEIMGTRTNSAV